MTGAPAPNQLLAQQQAMRARGLERAKKVGPDRKHDRKFFIIDIAAIVLICAGLMAVPFLGELLALFE